MQKIKNFLGTTQGKVIAVIVVLFFVGMFTSGDKKPSPSNSSGSVVASAPAPVDPAKLEADKARLAELKKKFDYKYDEFEKKGWYSAKSQVATLVYNTQVLRVMVNNAGYAYLADQYYGDNWLFHTRVEVSINGTIYKSDDIPTYDDNNEQTNSGGSVWEFISYTAGRDNGIIKAIAESGDAPIKVRFAGGSGGVKDFSLSQRDRQVIKDAYEMSNLIISTGDTGTQS